MKSVRVADLKAHLSEHLREVRRGSSIVVLDRDTPIARLVPYAPGSPSLAVRPPRSKDRPGSYRFPPPLRTDVDIVSLLLEERQVDR
jgi:prevent-host-death family protein